MDKIEAQNKANDKTREYLKEFCPLTQALCREGCVCFSPCSVRESETVKDSFFECGGGCQNMMFWRECNHSY